MSKDNNKSGIDITKAYQEATNYVIDGIRKKPFNSINNIKITFKKLLNTTTIELDNVNKKSLQGAVDEGLFNSKKKLNKIFNGRSFTEKDLKRDGVNQKEADNILKKQTDRYSSNAVYRQSYMELRSALTGITEQQSANVNRVLHSLAQTGENTILNARAVLVDMFKRKGVFAIEYRNGTKASMEGYVNMVTRTARIESANAEYVKGAVKYGSDLVKCQGSDTTCEVCALYQGKIFSVSGKDKRFPPLRDGPNSPLKNGYNVIHPNCRCEFLPYFEELQTPKELAADIKKSNEPFRDTRSTKQKERYQQWQAKNRQIREERIRYNEMRAVLGDDMQYSTCASLRRAMRSNENCFAYKKSHYAIRDYQQFQRWKTILDKNMPHKTLADFQQMKYNEPKKFETIYDYKLAIEKGKLSPLMSYEGYCKIIKEANSKLIGIKTSNGHIVKECSKHLYERIIGSIEDRRSGVSVDNVKRCLQEGVVDKKTINEDGKISIRFTIKEIGNVAFNPIDCRIIQVNPRRNK